jgi:hypothetical protein
VPPEDEEDAAPPLPPVPAVPEEEDDEAAPPLPPVPDTEEEAEDEEDEVPTPPLPPLPLAAEVLVAVTAPEPPTDDEADEVVFAPPVAPIWLRSTEARISHPVEPESSPRDSTVSANTLFMMPTAVAGPPGPWKGQVRLGLRRERGALEENSFVRERPVRRLTRFLALSSAPRLRRFESCGPATLACVTATRVWHPTGGPAAEALSRGGLSASQHKPICPDFH